MQTVTKLNTVDCPKCERRWDKDSEQGIAVDFYGECIVCMVKQDRFTKYHRGRIWDERHRRGLVR